MALWKSLLASKRKEIKQKANEEWQQKLKTYHKKINDQKLVQQPWFPLRKALKN